MSTVMSEVLRAAEKETQDFMAIVKKSEDCKCEEIKRVLEAQEASLEVFQESAKESKHQAMALLLQVRQSVRLVELGVLQRVGKYEVDFRGNVAKAVGLLCFVKRQAFDTGCGHSRRDLLFCKDIDETGANLTRKVTMLNKEVFHRISRNRHEFSKYCMLSFSFTASSCLGPDPRPSLERSLHLLAQMKLASLRASQLIKPVKHLVIASIRSAIGVGLESLDVKAALKDNAEALVQIRRDPQNEKWNLSRSRQQLTSLETISELAQCN